MKTKTAKAKKWLTLSEAVGVIGMNYQWVRNRVIERRIESRTIRITKSFRRLISSKEALRVRDAVASGEML